MFQQIALDQTRDTNLGEALSWWLNSKALPDKLSRLPGQPTNAYLLDVSPEDPRHYRTLSYKCAVPLYGHWHYEQKTLAEEPDQAYFHNIVYPHYTEAKQLGSPTAYTIRTKICDRQSQYHRLILPIQTSKRIERFLVMSWIDFYVQTNADKLALLSTREKECLLLLADGYGVKAIAYELSITVRTVRHHIASVKSKLRAKNATHAVAMALVGKTIC